VKGKGFVGSSFDIYVALPGANQFIDAEDAPSAIERLAATPIRMNQVPVR